MESLTNLFGKYRKKDSLTKVLLIFLILEGMDLSKVKQILEITDDFVFGQKIRKLYGITEDYVDVARIQNELERIEVPIICSPIAFEYHSDSKIIYSYKPRETDKPLWINDINTISKVMIITESCIVSSNFARPTAELDNNGCGFMFFVKYVLHNEVTIGRWTLSYKENNFTIGYLSETSNGQKDLLILYTAFEVDKAATYKWVIFIIQKESSLLADWKPDNFETDTLEMEE